MSLVGIFIVCLYNLLSCTEFSIGKQSSGVRRNDLNVKYDNSSRLKENVTYHDKVNYDKDSDIYVNSTSQNISGILKPINNSVYLEIVEDYINTTNTVNSMDDFNDTLGEKEKRQFSNLNDTVQNHKQFEKVVYDRKQDNNYPIFLNNNDTENANKTYNILNEDNTNNTIIGIKRRSIRDNNHQFSEETSLNRNKRDIVHGPSNIKRNVKLQGKETESKGLRNKKEQTEETRPNVTEVNKMLSITTTESPFDKDLEYSEEDLSVGVHTFDKDTNTNYSSQEDPYSSMYKTSIESEMVKFLKLVQNLPGGRENIQALRPHSLGTLLLHDTGPQEFYLPPACLIEWEDCKSEGECCQPLHCTELPSFPTVGHVNESTILEIKRFCSRLKSTAFKDLKTTRADVQEIVDTYKKKILEVLKN